MCVYNLRIESKMKMWEFLETSIYKIQNKIKQMAKDGERDRDRTQYKIKKIKYNKKTQ